MPTINSATLAAARQKATIEIAPVLHTKVQFNNMFQDAVDCLLDTSTVTDLNTCINSANSDFTPSQPLLDLVIKVALQEAANQK